MKQLAGRKGIQLEIGIVIAALGCSNAGVPGVPSSGGDAGAAAAAGAAGAGSGSAGGGATEPWREGVVEVLLVDDFEDGDAVNELGGAWHAFDDRHEGGESVSWPESAFLGGGFTASAPGFREHGYAARLIGKTGSVLGWDYIGLTTGLGPNCLCPLAEPPTIELPTYDGVQFMAKATMSSGPLYVKLSLTKDGEADNCAGGLAADSLTGYCDHEFDFSPTITADWTLVRMPFSAMTQPSWGPQIPIEEVLPTAKEISWLFQTRDGEVDLWIDDISLYKELPQSEPSFPRPVVSGTAALSLSDDPEDPASGALRTVTVSDRDFATAVEVTSDAEPRMLWDLLLHAPSETAIEVGDLLHVELQARCVVPPAGEDRCRATFIFQRDADPYTRSLTLPLSVGDEWTSFAAPFLAAESSAAGAAAAVLFLGFPAQTLAVGGLRVTNHGDTVAAEALPTTPLTYEGREPDAPWRAEAAERIETYRRGELSLIVTDAAGDPVPGAEVTVTMIRPRFGFGTAVDVADLREGLTASDRDRYAAAIEGLCNVVVPENELKWPFLATATPPMTEPASWLLDWAEARSQSVRGHTLVWPGWGNLPAALRTEYEALVAAEGEAAAASWLGASVEAHVRETVSTFAGRIAHWDVINEPFDNRDLMNILGDEAMADWLRAARESDPTCRLFVNDYSVLSRKTTFSASRRHLRELVAGWVAADVPLDGIGFQAHFDADLTAPTELFAQLDEFASFGKELWITEFDLPPLPAELAADYTRDLMTILFSHPSAGGFVMWGLWDGNHYARSAPIYDAEWNEKPSGAAFRQRVFDEWWTDERGTTDAAGRFTTRAFHGDYQIVVTVGGETTEHHVAFDSETEPLELGP